MEFLNNYAKKDYGYVNKTSVIICPHCGKVMKLLPKKNWLSYKYYYDGDEETLGRDAIAKTETFICKDCGIKYKNKISSQSCYEPYLTEAHWILPKGFVPTCTQKQINYIKFLCKNYDHNIYVTSLEQANKLITDLLIYNEADKAKKNFRDIVVNKLKAAGFDCSYGYMNTDISIISKEDITKEYSTYKLNWNARTVNYTIELSFYDTAEITPEIVKVLETTKVNKEIIEKILKGEN